MSLTAAEHLKARQMHAGDRSYANIGIALGKPADEVRDALTPGRGMTEQAPIAIVSDYDGLIEALQERLTTLGMTHTTMDELTGLPGGYTGKIFGAARIKNLTQASFGLVLNALGVKMILVEDKETMLRFASQREKRERPAVHASRLALLGKATLKRVTPAVLSDVGRRGHEARMLKVSPERRKQIGKRAAQARWKWQRMKRKKRAATNSAGRE